MSMKMQRGISIIEVMVTLAIAMVILLAVTRAYLSGFYTQQTQVDVTRLNESMRFAFDLVSKELRKAGYRNSWQLGSVSSNTFCSTPAAGTAISLLQGLNDPATINPAAASMAGTTWSISNRSDVLRVSYYGDVALATGGSAPVLDCQGYPAVAGSMSADTLFVANDASNNNEPTLFCHTTNASNVGTTNPGTTNPMPLVAGVESMQLLYGEDTDGDGIINRYVPWQLLTNSDNVLSVKLSVVVRSPNGVAVTSAQPTFNHFSSGPAGSLLYAYPSVTNGDPGAIFTPVAADRRIRQMLSTEIAVRNYRWCGA